MSPFLSLAPGREAGLQCLREFLPAVGAYAASRNFDRGFELSTSGLSPYLRNRLVREREVVATVLREFDYETAARFIEEVSWRSYWKGFLEMRPAIWTDYCKDARRLPCFLNEEQQAVWSRARGGQTGIECFDAWVDQLVTTGWLHNHARMWFASIWVFTLELPWQLGAAFFLEHLLDGDPASNTLSWRWVAGLHTPGKHYLALAENIRRFTEDRYFPDGKLNETAQPLPSDGPYAPAPLAPVSPVSEAEFPSLSMCPAGLLVTPEDLSPEVGELGQTPFSSISVFNADDIMNSTGASHRVREFTDAAVQDTADRISHHWSARKVNHEAVVPRVESVASPGHVGCREPLRVHSGRLEHWIDGVVTWAENENLKSVWMLQPPIGPWRDSLPALRASLRMRSVQLVELRRSWDSVHWPSARGGFFHFRKELRQRIENLLREA